MNQAKLWIFLLLGAVCAAHADEHFKFQFSAGTVEISTTRSAVFAKINNSTAKEFRVIDDSLKDSSIIADFNFDGYLDIAVSREVGIEKYYDIYLFDSRSGEFKADKKLSDLPCPLLDQRAKRVIASCFHEGACESWEEVYRYRNNELSLTQKNGTSCDPNTGEIFKYREVYKNGKMTTRKLLR